MTSEFWQAFVGTLFMALILTGVISALLRRAHLIDVPNYRSSHTVPVPRGGGIAVLLVICVAAPLNVSLGSEAWLLLGVSLALGAVGLIDDIKSLSTSLRLRAQFIAAILLTSGLLLLGTASWWWMPTLVIVVVGYVNAFNFMDGINGISALTMAVVGGWWAWAGAAQAHDQLHVLGLVLMGVAIGFLPWNAPQAKVFLGDVGSYGIGLFIVGLSAIGLTSGLPWHWVAAPLLVYVSDTGWTLIRRARAGKGLSEAHREHVYQRLVDNGWSHLASSAACATASALVCMTIGISGPALTWWAPPVVLGLTLGYLSLPKLKSTATVTSHGEDSW